MDNLIGRQVAFRTRQGLRVGVVEAVGQGWVDVRVNPCLTYTVTVDAVLDPDSTL